MPVKSIAVEMCSKLMLCVSTWYMYMLCVTHNFSQVLKMALQVLSILSTSKVGLEIDAQTEPRPKPALTSTLATQADGKPKASTDTRTRSPVQAKAKETKSKAVVATTESKPQLNKYFRLFLLELLKMFGTDRALLERKGNLLIRQVCIDSHRNPLKRH